jgi:hypothetical protein
MASTQLLENTLKTWQPYYSFELTNRDAEEICDNWSAYVSLLAEWTQTLKIGQVLPTT